MSTLTISSLQELDTAASRFLDMAGDYRVMAFSGELGAGKTPLFRLYAGGWGLKLK